MSQNANILKLENCIALKLWYTSHAIYKLKGKGDFSYENGAADLCRSIGYDEYQSEDTWALYKLLDLLSNDGQNKTNEWQLNLIQLKNALHLIDKDVPIAIEKELLKLYNDIAVTKNTNVEVSFKILPSSLEFLKVNLRHKPTLVQWIIDQLLCIWCTSFADTDSVLQDLYSNIINEIFTSSTNTFIDDSKNQLQYMPKNIISLNEENLAIILCILSKFNITELKERDLNDWLCLKLFKSCRFKDVELSFYSRRDQKYFKMWHLFLDDVNARNQNPDNFENALKIKSAIFEPRQDSIIFLNTDELFIRVLRRKVHWLSDIIDIAYTLMMNDYLDDVVKILNNSIFNSLWLPLLLKVLNNCLNAQITGSNQSWKKLTSITMSLRFLIKNCKLYSFHDLTLSRIECTIENHLNVLDWIIKCRKLTSIHEKSSESNKHQICSVNHIFTHLQFSSVLSVIKMFVTDFHVKPFDEINDLLTIDNEAKSVYRSYYAMLSALKAIFLCHSYNSQFMIVADHYKEMEHHINNLNLLSLRLEVIENIFSMIFLHQEHFVITENIFDISDNEENDEKNEKHSSSPRKISYQHETGFICNKYAIRETLHYLGRCTFAANDKLLKLQMDANLPEDAIELEQRISTIRNFLAEASWRLKLLTDSKFFESQGLSDMNNNSSPVTNKPSIPITHSHVKSTFYKLDEYSSSDDMDFPDMDESSENGSIKNTNHQNSKRRKRLKNSNSVDGSSNTKGSKEIKEFTLNHMLASKESLILRCLWKNDYKEAQRIIKKFNMKRSSLAGEIMFSHAMRIFRNDITKQLTLMTQQHSDTDKPELHSKYSTLDVIRKAAQDGIQASRTTSQVETFLISQKSNISQCTDCNNTKEIMTLTTMDFALTMGYDIDISENLAELAMKYLRTCKKLEKTRYYEFFETIYHIFYEKKNTSIVKIICDATIPLSLKQQRECNEYWSNLTQKLKEFESKKNLIDVIDDENDREQVKNEMHEILSICGIDKKYLHRLYDHIQWLRSIAPPLNEFAVFSVKPSLLQNSLEFYIGYQIFDLNVELEAVKTISDRFQINFLYSILVNCCPKLSCSNNINNMKDFQILEDQWGVIILNKYKNTNDNAINVNSHDPNQCVIEILTDLLQIIRELNSTSSFLLHIDRVKMLYKMKNIRKTLQKTQCLINLDLSHLSFGNHTLAFFLNVWNLMLLHAIIQIWSHNLPLNDLQQAISLTTLGYEIGDLGFVTLSTLRKKLIGQSLYNTLDTDDAEELNEPAWQDLDLQQDSRVIFAMINEFKATPIIKIYHPESLNDELCEAANNYLEHYVNEGENVLPQLVKKYRDFYESTDNTKFIFEKYFKDNEKIEYETFKYSYNIEFEYGNKTSIDSNCIVVNERDNNANIWMHRKIKPNLLQYLEDHCWLLSYLVQRIHHENPILSNHNSVNIDNMTILENLLNSQWIQNLKSLTNDNSAVAGLWHCISTIKLWNIFDVYLKTQNFEKCLTIIDALPHSLIIRNIEIQRLKDKILAHLINRQSELSDSKILQYLYHIKDVRILAQIVLANVKKWPVNVCNDILRHVLSHVNKNNLPLHCRVHMDEILCRVLVFDKIQSYCNMNNTTEEITWYDIVCRTEKSDPISIVKFLIDANEHELCLKWLEYQTVSSEIQSLVSHDLFIGLLKNENDNFQQARKLLQALPISLSIKLCKAAIEKLESINTLKFIVKYLIDNCATEHDLYRRIFAGVEILEQLDIQDRRLYINLINNPLLMLEQLLMNGKFASLQRIITNYSDIFKFADIPIEDFDQIVRFYAKKSLDSRVAIQRDMIDTIKVRDSSLNDSGEFIMPINTPTRDEWIPNDKTRECSCCKIVIFSMFNRRHHCRRCGRVVCASCSSQRMRVLGYADSVQVRVCNDCKSQTTLQVQGASSTPSSEICDYWRLTNDETHNRTLREEFCFEHAPNIPLCLAILNLHSDHKAYANFLFDRCDEMKKLLRPDAQGRVNPEIDHNIIINMIRSLLVAAKVKCAKLGLNTGLTYCDRFLSQVDLIATLVQSNCCALIPRDDLNDHTLRRLRDLLTEKEQWILALNLSTKSGLETQGVWAAWGKACLKVGYYESAREKFSHCLQRVHQEDFDDWVVLSYPGDSRELSNAEQNIKKKESKLCETLKNRPNKDPPLLLEILQILEISNSTNECSERLTRTNSTAQEIFNKLNSLKAISLGQYTITKPNSKIENFRYHESLFYLLMYGSFNSILEFFVRHGEFDKYLSYVLENNIESELFFNIVFLGCLKNGTIEKLFAAMKSKDPTLLIWKKYLIYTCHNLEKKLLLHTLYQLQLFMCDYIRAAMTCIRFYVTDVSNYIELCSRNHFLHDARKHLETALQLESTGKHKRRSTTSTLSGHNNLTMEMEPPDIDRHINTISRQMEIAKFLGACEKEGRSVNDYLSKLSFMDSEGLQPRAVPTLFGNQQERTHLSVLAILCGRDVEEGFGIAFRVMQDYNLRPQKVYFLVGHILAQERKTNSIEQLIKCCRSSGAPNSNVISDRVLTHCVKFFLDRSRTETNPGSKDQIDSLIRIITDVELKIASYIESKQLKAAYLLAVKHSRAQDIHKILKEADNLGQSAIKSICTKWLQLTQQN